MFIFLQTDNDARNVRTAKVKLLQKELRSGRPVLTEERFFARYPKAISHSHYVYHEVLTSTVNYRHLKYTAIPQSMKIFNNLVSVVTPTLHPIHHFPNEEVEFILPKILVFGNMNFSDRLFT